MNRRLKHVCFWAAPLLILLAHSNFFYTRLTAGQTQADNEKGDLTLFNKSNAPVYAATYCKNIATSNSKRTSSVIMIPANESAHLDRPSSSAKCARYIIFSYAPEQLTESLSKKALAKLGSVGIGATSGGIISSKFYIQEKNGKLSGSSSTLEHLLRTKTILKTLYDTELQMALQKSLHYKHDPHQSDVAEVRIGDQIPVKEAEFIAKRKQINKAALEKLLGKKLNGSYIPTIAFVSSGGGARALISSLGMHVGAEKTGLLDCITYDAGLSGGSWSVGLWQQSQVTPSKFKEIMQPIMARGLNPTRADNFTLTEIQNILNGLMFRKATQQPVTLVTLWGAMLANRYLSPYEPYSQDIFFSELYEKIADAQFPFPILAAVNGRFADLGVNLEKAEWFEFTPLEAGGSGNWLGHAHIPMWAFGRTFKDNQSIDSKAEYDLGQLMGICGSAFAFTMGRAFAETVGKISVKLANTITQTLGEELVANARVSVGKVPNFTKNVPGSIVKDFDDLRLVDAGMSFNIPIPSVLHAKRKADIMIIMDASGGTIGKALKLAEGYAQHHNLDFPLISYDEIKTKALNIYEGNKTDTPTIIHLSRAVDRNNIQYPSFIPQGYSTEISTGQFQYSADEFNNLSGITEENLVQNLSLIKEAISKKIELHNGFAQ